MSGVEERIKEGCFDNAFKDAGRVVSNSWVEIARGDQSKIINDAVQASSEIALQRSINQIDSNLTERKKRSRNVIISNVPENSRGDNLTEVVCAKLNEGLTKEDILSCRRLGKPGEKPRVILCVMRKEDDAVFFTNNGRGRKFAGDIWVNPDLTRTEREAMYLKRKEKKDNRRQDAPPIIDPQEQSGLPGIDVSEELTIVGEVQLEAEAQNESTSQPQPGSSAHTDSSNQDGVGT